MVAVSHLSRITCLSCSFAVFQWRLFWKILQVVELVEQDLQAITLGFALHDQ